MAGQAKADQCKPTRAPTAAALAFLMLATAPRGVGHAQAAPPPAGRAAVATGDLRRSYEFAQVHQTMPYRLYVPSTYDGRKPFPLIVCLHGAGGDENSIFDETSIARLAEARGVIVVAPLGYSRFGGYGDFYPIVGSNAAAEQAAGIRWRSEHPDAPPTPSERERLTPPSPEENVAIPAALLAAPDKTGFSEQDVMNVLSRVRAEFRIDPARIYLMGNSMGGIGTLYLAAKYPGVWAAIAPAGGPIEAWTYPYQRLREHHVAALFIHGEFDEHSNPRWSKALADHARAAGVEASFLLMRGENHGHAWIAALPQTFDFLLAHTRSEQPASALDGEPQP